jgi:hypothetical protein
MAGENTQDLAMEHFCAHVITSIVSGFSNPAPAAGKHGSFIGATTGMAVS